MPKPADPTMGRRSVSGTRVGHQSIPKSLKGQTIDTKDHGDIPTDDDPGELRYPKNGAGPIDPAG